MKFRHLNILIYSNTLHTQLSQSVSRDGNTDSRFHCE